ncbi:AAA family ATPase [candidate division FCPU426 bacterium]|nr:AAA family ATPase [candidate division FCPU426 bacterium]
MALKKVFIAATRQNVGKTLMALGLLGNLHQQKRNIGYIKPVGQRTIMTDGYEVDEDALLMEKVFAMGADLQDMNPVRVGKGFTAEYIRHGRNDELENQILECFARVSAGRDFVVVEGTGHAGVGSVLDLSNARVAKLLNTPVIMVAPGGVGRPIDEVALNYVLLQDAGVPLAGVVVNKVKMHKYERVQELVVKGFARKGIRVLGVLPFDDVLSAPTVGEVMIEVDGDLISHDVDEKALEQPVKHNLVGAMSAHQALDYFKPGSLIITPGDREDIILAAIGMALSDDKREESTVSGIVLTGHTIPHPAILELIHRSRIPVITCSKDTYTVASQIHDLMVKISPGETAKIEHAIQLIKEHVDVESLYSLL